jgi:hypothetical protein
MERIKEAEAGFRSLTEAIDTTTAPGRMMTQMVGAFAEFERAILRERTKTGLDAARKQGRIASKTQTQSTRWNSDDGNHGDQNCCWRREAFQCSSSYEMTGSPEQKHNHQHDQPDCQGAEKEWNHRQQERDVSKLQKKIDHH